MLRPDTTTRRERLIHEALNRCGVVNYEDVKKNYAGLKAPKAAFREDVDKIVSTLKAAETFLTPLGFHIPDCRVEADRLVIPVRSFAELLHPGRVEPKQRLARHLIDAYHEPENGEPRKYRLIPRSGAIYLGIGATMYELAREIIRQRSEFRDDFHVYTQNLELAALFNCAAPKDTRLGSFNLEFPGLRMDFNSGSLYRSEMPPFINTAVVGVHCIRLGGELFTASPKSIEWTQKFLDIADKIIIFATKGALGDRHAQGTIDLPSESTRVYFVTNHDFPDGYCPPNAKHIRLEIPAELNF